MHSDEYRILQEERFGNNTGASFTEIVFVTQLPFILNIFALICSFKTTDLYYRAGLQFLVTFIPQILLITCLSEYLYQFYTILCVIGVTFLIYVTARQNAGQKLKTVLKYATVTDHRLSCVTNFRAIVNSFSVICILAADFQCFPKKYLKTNTHGYGLMDTGVGLYVISNALVNSHFTVQNERKKIKVISLLWSTFQKTLPLLIIGVGRFIATAAVQYHQSVSEYGVHWNFFISLSALAFFNEILMLFVHKMSTVYTLIVVLSSLHEYTLYAGLKSWVNGDSPRVGFISSNREGICSLLGYEIIYLCGLTIKHFLPRKGDKCKICIRIIYKFFIAFIAFAFMTKIFENSFGVSRKLANIGYIVWIISVSLLSLANTMLVEFIVNFLRSDSLSQKKNLTIKSLTKKNDLKIEQVPTIIQAINYNGLAFFLLGNVLTGLINICIPTLTVNSFNSIIIIIFYVIYCCLAVFYLYLKNIRLR